MIEEVIERKVIYRTTYTGDTSIIDAHNKHLCSFDQGRTVSNRGGYQSNNITFGYQELLKFIFDSFKDIEMNVYLINFWLNINKGTDYNKEHIHDLDGMSAVYYHKVCCENSPLVFHNPIPTLYSQKYKIVPRNQEIVFFDSKFPHSVKPCNNPNHERISIAFNFRFS